MAVERGSGLALLRGGGAALLLVAGTPGFGWRAGEVWGAHLAWSGDAATWTERLPDGTSVLGASELLGPGEIILAPGAEYTTPWLYAAWSPRGLDGLSAALHAWQRARPSHPAAPRPVVLNTWEAVYFEHRLDRLTALADTAARLGVERFVLDDGWFRQRRDDTAGLGDWFVDEGVWPAGLHPLVDHVRGLGMQFGLWVEPEMVNPDSDLFRAHPDWVLRPGGRLPVEWRHQHVLDLSNPDAFASSATEIPGRARLEALDPARAYRVTPVPLAGGPHTVHAQPPPWYAAGGTTLTGRALALSGLQMPALAPEQALLLHAAGA